MGKEALGTFSGPYLLLKRVAFWEIFNTIDKIREDPGIKPLKNLFLF